MYSQTKIKMIQMNGMILTLIRKWMITRLWKRQRGLRPFLFVLFPELQYSFRFEFYFSSRRVPLANCRRSILGMKVKREFGENDTKVQVGMEVKREFGGENDTKVQVGM